MPGFQQRSQRLLLVCITLSVVLHLALLAVLRGFVGHQELPAARVLDVVLVKPETPPVAAPAPPQPSLPDARKPPRQREPKSMHEKPDLPSAEEPRKPETGAPLLALPEARPAVGPSLGVSPSPAETRGAPDTRSDAAARQREAPAVTPPAFNAAYLRNPPPQYPLVARRNGEQGTVMLRVLVTREGLPASVSVEKTSGSGHLDGAALESVRTWRFAPARRGTQPVEAWVLVPIVFRLEGSS